MVFLSYSTWVVLYDLVMLSCFLAVMVMAGSGLRQEAGTDVIPADAVLTQGVGGLEATGSSVEVVDAPGAPLGKALEVTIGARSLETNATQLTIPTTKAVKQGDKLLAEIWVREMNDGEKEGRVELLFEGSSSPWTKSLTQGVEAPSGGEWRHAVMAFESAIDYPAGGAMVSVRLAFGPQKVQIGGVRVINYEKTKSLDELLELAALASGGKAMTLAVDLKDVRQTMVGLGGNFCQPRYGRTESMDAVGKYVLENLDVRHSRVGVPLDYWAPEPGVYKEEGQAAAAMQAMKLLNDRGIPVIASVWEGAGWLLGGDREQMGRKLPVDRYDECAKALGEFFVLAKSKYRGTAQFFSFNEADIGVNFKFEPEEIAAFMKVAGPMWKGMGLDMKFLVADTANGTATAAYAKPLLEDPELKEWLGPVAFHSWDALNASDEAYRAIADLGVKYGKEVWCTEAGHDAQLWRKPDPWAGWENALGTAQAYARVVRMTRSSVIHYWTYQDNYPLVDGASGKPFAVFDVMDAMEEVFAPGWKVVGVSGFSEVSQAAATVSPDGKEVRLLLVNTGAASRISLSGVSGAVSARAWTKGGESELAVEGRSFEAPVRSVMVVRVRGE